MLKELNNEFSEKLVGRQVRDASGTLGKIVSVMSKRSKCEVSVNFKDGIKVLETRFTINDWIQNSF